VYKQPIGTTILDASVRDEGHMFHEKRTPSRSSASTKSHPDIVKMGGGGEREKQGDRVIMPRNSDFCEVANQGVAGLGWAGAQSSRQAGVFRGSEQFFYISLNSFATNLLTNTRPAGTNTFEI
jgi:hypothetical protein